MQKRVHVQPRAILRDRNQAFGAFSILVLKRVSLFKQKN